jgi:hypothetical protein
VGRDEVDELAHVGDLGEVNAEEERRVQVGLDVAQLMTEGRLREVEDGAGAGQAAGEVDLAHEPQVADLEVHYLLAFPAHSRVGLMRASFDGRQLGSWDRRGFQLEASALPRLRARVARLVSFPEPLVAADQPAAARPN